MEAATKAKPESTREARELALKFGAVMLNAFGGRGGDVLRVIDESGLSFVQMKALVALEDPEQGDPRTVTRLAEELGVSAASASRAVEGLVRKRLATRLEDPDDRRVKRLTLSPKGHDLAERIISARLAGIEDFAATLTASERRKLETALDALLEREEIAEIYRTYESKVR